MADGETPPPSEALRELARLHGVETEHRDGFDRTVRPGAGTLRAVLAALGALPDEEGDPAEAVRARRDEGARRILEPVTVIRTPAPTGEPSSFLPLGPGARPDAPAEVRIRWEEGGDLEVRKRVRPGAPPGVLLPEAPPTGYHEVEVEAGGRRARGRLIVAPARAYRAPGDDPGPELREWGLFLPLHALRSEAAGTGVPTSAGTPTAAGAGTLPELGELLRWTGARGGGAVGTLPLLAQYLDGPVEPSPYAPASRLFWNEIFLDPARLPEWERSPEARELAASPESLDEARRLDEAELVDYEGVARRRHRILDALARSWWEAEGSGVAGSLPPGLVQYADFRGAVARIGLPGRGWDDRWGKEGIPREAICETVRLRHLYAQLRFGDQLDEVRRAGHDEGAGLYLDLPLGTHPGGFDPWSRPALFARDASLGAPPDGFQEEGQDWGLPPLRPPASRDEGHEHLAAVVRTLMARADYLRIDHVMGLHRMYWVPRGRSARDGAYVRWPAPELYAVLALESHRNRTILVGEDLGTVPDEVPEAMDREGVRRSFVVPFELDADGLRPVPEGAVASLNTHDLPTFAGYWRELDEAGDPRLEALARAAGVPKPRSPEPWPVLVGLLRRLGESRAGLVLVNLEDLWLEERPQNRPGIPDPANWRGRARRSLDELRQDPKVLEALVAVAAGREAAERSAPAGATSTKQEEA